MKNFPIIDKETGREYWISRSVAVVVAVFTKNSVLVIQRGKGTPDPEYVDKYCLPCGYLDFDETCVQAAQRELKEETGLTFPISDFKLVSINDIPNSDKRQNITFRFRTELGGYIDDWELSDKFSETNEVSDIKWIDLREINNYKWAFGHEKIITEIKESNKN